MKNGTIPGSERERLRSPNDLIFSSFSFSTFNFQFSIAIAIAYCLLLHGVGGSASTLFPSRDVTTLDDQFHLFHGDGIGVIIAG